MSKNGESPNVVGANVSDLAVADLKIGEGALVTTIKPVFLLFTASFWLGIFPTILSFLDFLFALSQSETGGPVATAIASILSAFGMDITGEGIGAFMQKMYPLYFALFMWQRGDLSGMLGRPYTLDKTKADTVIRAVENGKTAFEVGKEMGAKLKDGFGLKVRR